MSKDNALLDDILQAAKAIHRSPLIERLEAYLAAHPPPDSEGPPVGT